MSSVIVGCAFNLPLTPASKPATPTVVNEQPAEVPSFPAPVNETGWNTVKSYNGTDGTTTPAFHVSGSEWRIVWSVDTQEPQYAVFDLLVFRQENAGILIDRISYSPGASGDVVQINEGGHDYYLKVIPANLSKWTVDVEENSTVKSDQPVQITNIRYKGMDFNVGENEGHSVVEWDEYVEIKNFSDEPQNVAGWKLKNVTRGDPTFIFPENTPCSCEYLGKWSECIQECYPPHPCTIGPRESIRVYTGEPQWEYGGYCFYYYQGNIWDNATPDTAVLYNSEGQEVSRRSYSIFDQGTAAK